MVRFHPVVTALLVAALLAFGLLGASMPSVVAAPEVFASPINGGCYIAAENLCKIHIDPFTINIDDGAGAKLERFTLQANGQPIYDFRTDVSNPPGVDYSPSLVALDFAATCGVTYTVNIVGKDTLDTNILNMGQFEDVVCPSTVPD